MAREYTVFRDGLRTFDREAFEQDYGHLDPVSFKGQLRAALERFRTRPAIPAPLRRAVYERDGHACVECGAGERLSLDHVFPYSRGGRDTYENLRTLCVPCNSRKGAMV